jgi:hypothetical protein
MTTVTAPDHDLVTALHGLWPGAHVAREQERGRPGEVQARYAFVPNAASPRMLVPLDSPRAAGAALRRWSTASSSAATLGRAGAARMARHLPGVVLRDRVEVRGGDPGLAHLLGAVLGQPVTFSLTVGSPRVNRKPVLQVFGEDGRSLAFAKLGVGSRAADDVRTEGANLARLEHVRLERVVPPEVIARTEWHGHPLLVATSLEPPVLHWSRGRWSPPVRAMEELADAFAEPERPLLDSAWWHRLWRQAAGLPRVLLRERLGRCLNRVQAQVGSDRLAWGAWHGDWTPWNMARDGSRVLLWDWERFETGVPRGLDEIHYVVNELTTRHGTTPGNLLAGVRRAAGDELRPGSPGHTRAVLYVAAIACRYLSLAHGPGGEHIAPRAVDCLVALESLCEL